MRAYKVTSPVHEDKIILAETARQAADMMVVWQVLNRIEAAEFVVDSDWVHELSPADRRELDETLSWNKSGIAVKRPDGGFGIRGLQDEQRPQNQLQIGQEPVLACVAVGGPSLPPPRLATRRRCRYRSVRRALQNER